MKLFTFAYKSEAHSFIKNDAFQKVNEPVNGLYRNANDFLLITGEGIDSTNRKLTKFFSEYKINLSNVFNLGIAGSLDKNLNLESVNSIRKVYLEDGKESFFSADTNANIDCITAKNRVMDKKYANQLSPIASLVDRELWACAKVCYRFQLPFLSIKLISDYAGTTTSTEQIIKRAKEFSQKLFEHYFNYFREI